jgi:hypothetical protein
MKAKWKIPALRKLNKCRLDKLMCNYQNLNSIYSELFRMSLKEATGE